MKKNLHLILIGICTITASTHGASSNPPAISPTGTGWTDYLTANIQAVIGWGEKKTGKKPLSYCIDKKAERLLKDTELTLELAFADNRAKGITKTYAQLLNNPTFKSCVERLNEHAYFEWRHILQAIQGDELPNVIKFEKLNRINLPPTLRFAIQLYLAQAKEDRKSAVNPKDNQPRFDLSLIQHAPGYVEAALPAIDIPKIENDPTKNEEQLSAQTKILRDYEPLLAISSPIQRAERRVRKSVDPSFSHTYLTSTEEVTKSKRIYAVYFAYLRRQFLLQRPITDLFNNPNFIDVYNQVWDRDTHLRSEQYAMLARGSLDACDVYANHKENISPFFAALTCDMILSHEQKAEHVPEGFKAMFLEKKKPYEKYIFMFLNSLTKQNKINLLHLAHHTIPEVCKAVNADDTQISLVAEIAQGGHLTDLLLAIRKARMQIPPAPAPLYPSGYEPIAPMPQSDSSQNASIFVLEIDLPEQHSEHHGHLPAAGHSDQDEETGSKHPE